MEKEAKEEIVAFCRQLPPSCESARLDHEAALEAKLDHTAMVRVQ